jgi:thiamine biosynthesis lipoprotein
VIVPLEIRGLLLFLVGAWLVASPRSAPTLVRYEGSRLSMACVYAIAAYGEDAAALPHILDEAFDEVDRIDRLMSHYKPESPLSRLNRDASAGPVAVDAELFNFIDLSLRYARESDGAFDITVGPLMKAWGFFRRAGAGAGRAGSSAGASRRASGVGGSDGEIDGRIPPWRELEALRRRVGYQHVRLNHADRTIQFDRPGVELDLGGIAKGYAVDRVVRLLKSRGVVAALVDAGGSTIYALGAPPGKAAWEVTLQDPLDARVTARTLPLKDRALSVAGRSEKSFEMNGVTYSHIMDPRTARPVQGMLSVAVLADSGTAGDALDDAFFVQGVEKSRAYLARLPGVEAFFFLPAPGHGWTMVDLPD